jgi:class 3 adenylate cyclase
VEERPVTRYVSAPDGVSLAYQVIGDGALDLVFFPGLALPIDLLWEDPGFAHFARRLGRFSRTVWLEGRGIGASGGDFTATGVDENGHGQMVYGLTSVLDAIGCEQVVLAAHGSAGPVAIRYAVTHSERVSTLVLVDSHAYYVREDGYPWGMPPDAIDRHLAVVKEAWGSGAALDALAPSKAGDERFRAWDSRSQRLGASPEGIAAAVRAGFQRDVRDLLPTLGLPTLVVHREGDRFIRAGAGRYLAEHIAGARYVGLPGEDHLFFVGDVDALLDEIEEFLTGTHQAPEGDVVTSTVMFTDIVSSTEQSARMGHRRWTKLADDHDAMVRAILGRYRGREVKTIGDGFLATFDSTTRAVHAAAEIVTGAQTMSVEVRAGVHNGEVEVRPDDVVGLAVTIAKRICDLAGPGEVLVSEAVKLHLVGSDIEVAERGTHVLKGVPDEWRLFAVAE